MTDITNIYVRDAAFGIASSGGHYDCYFKLRLDFVILPLRTRTLGTITA